MNIGKPSMAMTDKNDSEFEIFIPKDDSTTLENMTTWSDQICSTEVTDDAIEDARNKKVCIQFQRYIIVTGFYYFLFNY